MPACGAALANGCPQFYADGAEPRIVKPTLAKATRELCFATFGVTHSGVTRTPLWSAEYLTPDQLKPAEGLSRVDSFHAEEKLPIAERAELEDYKRSGYDRGHMSPNHDMPDRSAQSNSFSLANMVPQAPKVNRGLWSEIEQAVRNQVLSGRSLYVITGPLFEGQSLVQLNGRVLVPTSVFKAVYDPQSRQAAAYVVTNDKDASAREIKATIVSIAELEQRTGIDLFPHLSPQAKNTPMELPVPEASAHPHKRKHN